MSREWTNSDSAEDDEKSAINDDKIKVGDVIKLKLEGVGAKGDVFGRYKRIVVFVKGKNKMTDGEIIQAKVTLIKENCAFAEPC
jgi:predicted RNA-binding protein with TRAM domain